MQASSFYKLLQLDRTLLILTIFGLFKWGLAEPEVLILQTEFLKNQYDKQVDIIVSSIEKEQDRYKKIEKEIKSLFPKGTRKSPFYLSIRSDFLNYRDIMKGLDSQKLSLKSNLKKFKDSFSVGRFKSVDVLREGDDKWKTALSISKKIEKTLSEAEEDLKRVDSLHQMFSAFIEKMAGVIEFQKELESALEQATKELEKSSVKTRNLKSEFEVVGSDLKQYDVYQKVDSIRQILDGAVQSFSDTEESIKKLDKSLKYLMKGVGKPGDEKRVWELYQNIVDKNADLTKSVVSSARSADEIQQRFQNSLKLLKEFGQVVEEMDEGISQIKNRQKESESLLESDRARFKELITETTPSDSAYESPFNKLKTAFERSEKLLDGVGLLVDEASSVRERFISHIETMDGLKTDEKKYEIFKSFRADFKDIKNTTLGRIKEFEKALKEFWEFQEEFQQGLEEMDDGLELLLTRQQESEMVLEEDQIRLTSLMDAATWRLSTDQFPYTDLKSAFERTENLLVGTDQFYQDALDVKVRFVDHVGTMDGLKTDERKYDTFRSFEKEFKKIVDSALNRFKEFTEASEAFKAVIVENFLNTPQYWELTYKVEEKKSFSGERVIEENFGYIYDPSEYPQKPYHGKLISTFQLRLHKEKGSRGRDWNYLLIFEGSNDYPTEGLLLMDGDSALYQISSDEVGIKEEKRLEDRVTFVWELPVDLSLLNRIVKSEKLILKIHFLTVTHRVNLTLYRQKIFKEYEIPSERLMQWENMISREEETS